MQVDGKTLLHSAENILKNRRQEEGRHSSAFSSAEAGKKKAEASIHTALIQSRMLKLQATLKELQESYTREQIRKDYLQNRTAEIHAELQYNGKPLFPEYAASATKEEISSVVADNIKHLLRTLKGTQIEIENLYALNFKTMMAELEKGSLVIKELRSFFSSYPTKGLDPERVAKLTSS